MCDYCIAMIILKVSDGKDGKANVIQLLPHEAAKLSNFIVE